MLLRRLFAALRDFWLDVRQSRFPPEFRIGRPAWNGDEVAAMLPLLQEGKHPVTPQSATLSSAVPIPDLRFLADVVTNLWRLRQKMLQPGTDKPHDDLRRLYRHVESMWDALRQAGVSIRDHTGELVPEGGIYALEVLAFQPTEGISRSQVLETLKPTIGFQGQLLQMGEVIVGVPRSVDADKEDKTTTKI